MISDLTDEMLLSRIAQGEAEALGTLYDRYNRLAIGVAYRVLGERGAAEDTVQEAFLAVWRRVDSFDAKRGSARSWLLTIVRNGAIDRRRGKLGRAMLDTALDDVAYHLASDGEETFNVVAASTDAERVRSAMGTLPSEQREAIELAYFGGLTHQEIAERTGTALGTVKGRMRLGLTKLRQQISDMAPPDFQQAPVAAPTRTARSSKPPAGLILFWRQSIEAWRVRRQAGVKPSRLHGLGD
jgi:RNA polymerase sigma-70 factor, ECF subfamily